MWIRIHQRHMLMGADHTKEFLRYCEDGELIKAKRIYEFRKVDIHANEDQALMYSCRNGYIEIAKWIYEKGGINLNDYRGYIFHYCIAHRQMNVLYWWLSTDRTDAALIQSYAAEYDHHIIRLLYKSGFKADDHILQKRYTEHIK